MTADLSTLTVVSWNVNLRKGTWDTIQGLGADVVLLQEASKTGLEAASGYRVIPPPTDDWKIAGGGGAAATAIAVLNPDLVFEPIPLAALGQGGGEILESSHPGQFTAIRVPFGTGSLVLVSLYAIWKGSFADATLHRAISDLTPLLAKGTEMLVMGDMNVFRGYTLGDGKSTLKRYDAVFDRFDSLGLHLIGPFGAEPLAGCPCSEGPDCRHVRTYRHLNKVDSPALQLDFGFGTVGVQRALDTCRVLDEAKWWSHSDHAPVEIRLTTG